MPGGRQFLARYERQSGTPHAATALRNLSAEIDVGAVLPAISAPTLVLHRRDDSIIKFEKGQEVARLIKGARLVALDGRDHYLFSGDVDALLDEIEMFVTSSALDAVADDTVLATVLFVRVDATKAPLDRFSAVAKDVIDRFRGTLVSTDDSVVATFDGPGRAVRAAGVLRDELLALGVRARAGLQTAEIQRRGDDIAGVGVQIASQIARIAVPGEVWVSRTVTDLVAGTGLTFTERGEHQFEEIDGTWPLFAALV